MNDAVERAFSLKAFGQGVIELFFYLPIFMIAAVYVLPASDIWVWIATLPFCYWAASFITGIFNKLRYGVSLLLAIGIGALHGLLVIVAGAGEARLIPFVVCGFAAAIFAMRGISVQLSGWAVSFPNSRMLTAVIIYLAIQPMKLILFKRLVDYNGVLIVCGIASVILFFFFANERHLNNETIETGKTSATLAFKRQNRLMIIIIVGLISILALFRQIQQAIERFFHTMLDRIMSWLNQSEKQAPLDEQPINNPQPEMLPVEEVKPPSDWMLLLEKMLKVVGIVLIIIFVCIILFVLFKKLYQWGRLIAAKLLERGADSRSSAAGFTDEVESLMTLTNWREQMGNRLKKLLPKKRSFLKEWSGLASNTDKIRFLYSRLLWAEAERGYAVKAHLTPRETADDMVKWKEGKHKQYGMHHFIDVYEEVRYGDKLPDDQQVAAIKQQLDKELK